MASLEWKDVPLEMRLDSGPSALSETGRHERLDPEGTIEQRVPVDPNRETRPFYVGPGGIVSTNRPLHAILVQLNGPRAFDLFKIDRHKVLLGRMGLRSRDPEFGWGDPGKTEEYEKPDFSASADQTIVIDDPAVSRQHCKFRTQRDENGVVQNMILEDLESENGTWVNGKMVNQVVLNDRDVVKVGETELLFIRIWDYVRQNESTSAG